MIKSRLFVVNEETIETVKKNNIVSIKTPEPVGEKWLQTISDIMADMLQVEIGDYIFLWETRNKNNKSRIHGVYRAVSRPYYQLDSDGDEYPFKIKVDIAYEFTEPLTEYEILNNPYMRNPIWTIVGKKVKGKSRGTTPITPDEASFLLKMLIGKNKDYSYHPFHNKEEKVNNIIKIDYSINGDNKKKNHLKDINPSKLFFFDNNRNVRYEKILEAIFNQELSNRNSNFFNYLDIDVNKVKWYSNYLPYSIEQSEMDYVIMESDDDINITKIYLIEFQKTKVDNDHIDKCFLYSRWLSETLAVGSPIVQPVLICKECYDFINGEISQKKNEKKEILGKYIEEKEKMYGGRSLKIFAYNFSSETPKLDRRK